MIRAVDAKKLADGVTEARYNVELEHLEPMVSDAIKQAASDGCTSCIWQFPKDTSTIVKARLRLILREQGYVIEYEEGNNSTHIGWKDIN